MNIGTGRDWQQKGAAMALMKWTFEAADREKVAIYLDTVAEGAAQRLFEKMGFLQVGQFEMHLTKYGGQGMHSHIGMIRWPLEMN
jgi:RimJ/RimL family protein N-acetyltransferase